MVERYRRGKAKRRLMGNHQRCWVWGRNLIVETLRGARWLPVDVWLADDLPAAETDETEALAEALDVRVIRVSSQVLRQRCGSSEHQGFAARMPEFPYTPESELASILRAAPPALVLICDRLQDPYNLGAILRSAEALGAHAVLVGREQQVGVTSLVARASAGAVNHIPLIRCESLVTTTQTLRAEGLVLAACSEKAQQPLSECDLSGPAALIVGNEGTGVSADLLEVANEYLAIPLSGAVESLNVAAAAAIVLYEANRQRRS